MPLASRNLNFETRPYSNTFRIFCVEFKIYLQNLTCLEEEITNGNTSQTRQSSTVSCYINH